MPLNRLCQHTPLGRDSVPTVLMHIGAQVVIHLVSTQAKAGTDNNLYHYCSTLRTVTHD